LQLVEKFGPRNGGGEEGEKLACRLALRKMGRRGKDPLRTVFRASTRGRGGGGVPQQKRPEKRVPERSREPDENIFERVRKGGGP